jgi:hypothetical protein
LKICIAGQGAFGIKHIEAHPEDPGIEIVTLAGGSADSTREVAKKYRIPHWSTDLGECLAAARRRGGHPRDAHADARQQGIQCMRAGKHVQIEIPSPTTCATPKSSRACSRKPASSAWAATRAASIPRTSGCARRSSRASSRSSRWTCRRISSGART